MVMDKIALALLIVGGLNWGCIGLFQFDLVAFACGGSASLISRIIYTVVGLSAVWWAFPIAELFSFVLCVLFLRHTKKKEIDTLEQ